MYPNTIPEGLSFCKKKSKLLAYWKELTAYGNFFWSERDNGKKSDARKDGVPYKLARKRHQDKWIVGKGFIFCGGEWMSSGAQVKWSQNHLTKLNGRAMVSVLNKYVLASFSLASGLTYQRVHLFYGDSTNTPLFTCPSPTRAV